MYLQKGETMSVRTDNRIRKVIDNALGKEVRVRIDPYTTIRGEIFRVKFVKWRKRGRDKIAQFEIKMLCGSVKTPRVFIVEKLPNMNASLSELNLAPR